MRGLGKMCWKPPFLRFPALSPLPTNVHSCLTATKIRLLKVGTLALTLKAIDYSKDEGNSPTLKKRGLRCVNPGYLSICFVSGIYARIREIAGLAERSPLRLLNSGAERSLSGFSAGAVVEVIIAMELTCSSLL